MPSPTHHTLEIRYFLMIPNLHELRAEYHSYHSGQVQAWQTSSSMKTIHRPIVKQQQSVPLARPCNVYNIFFILERARIIQQFCSGKDAPAIQLSPSSINFFGYEQLSLPDLPPRYCDLILPPDWFVPGKNAKRKHVATNGRECKLEIVFHTPSPFIRFFIMEIVTLTFAFRSTKLHVSGPDCGLELAIY